MHDVTAALGVTTLEMMEHQRGPQTRRVRQARAVQMWLMREMTEATYDEIGQLLECHEYAAITSWRAVQTEIKAERGFYRFALLRVLDHARVSGPLLANDTPSSIAP